MSAADLSSEWMKPYQIIVNLLVTADDVILPDLVGWCGFQNLTPPDKRDLFQKLIYCLVVEYENTSTRDDALGKLSLRCMRLQKVFGPTGLSPIVAAATPLAGSAPKLGIAGEWPRRSIASLSASSGSVGCSGSREGLIKPPSCSLPCCREVLASASANSSGASSGGSSSYTREDLAWL